MNGIKQQSQSYSMISISRSSEAPHSLETTLSAASNDQTTIKSKKGFVSEPSDGFAAYLITKGYTL